ncbi:MAG TPA: nucleoside-diphosphate kinase [Candidatus Babeliales bacterium]|nr:nucleoside-diphosphate kinase [Candidatus Babeliales bacterium]
MNKTTISIIILTAFVVIAAVIYSIHRQQKQGASTVVEKTFAIIKPDAVAAKNSGPIIAAIEQNGFNIVGMRKLQMNKETAETFYAVHAARPFFGELVEFIISGPVVVLALEKENAIKAWRDLMGATDPKQAAEGTLRKQFGANIGNNALHGSDAPETAATELGIFFPELNK